MTELVIFFLIVLTWKKAKHIQHDALNNQVNWCVCVFSPNGEEALVNVSVLQCPSGNTDDKLEERQKQHATSRLDSILEARFSF